jgi:DNA-directed RNA polymerase specialized sigma24 family protein
MKLTRHAAGRILAAVESVRHDHLVKRATAGTLPDADETAAWVHACGLLLQAARLDPRVRQRLLSPIRGDVAGQVMDTLLKAASEREDGSDVTPAQAHAAMELADAVTDAFEFKRPALRTYVRSTTRDRTATEDILQQACLNLLSHARAHPEHMRGLLDDGFAPYAQRTVRNACMKWFRSHRDVTSRDDGEIERAPDGSPAEIVPGGDDDDGRPLREAGEPWTPLMRFGASCDGLVPLVRRCDGVLDRYVQDGRVRPRQRDSVADSMRAVLVSKATGLHHKTRGGRFEVWEVLSDLEGLTRFGAEILFVSGTTPETLKKNACMRRRELVDSIVEQACLNRDDEDDGRLPVAA